MNTRAKGIVRTLLVCLLASTTISLIKLLFGIQTDSLAFVADGIHSLFDSAATVLGILSITASAKPPDEEHPYGHHKFETVSALLLAFFLLFAAYEMGSLSYTHIKNPGQMPVFSVWGIVIMVVTLFVNLGIAKFESQAAKAYNSSFLESDSVHNHSDVLITIAVLISVACSYFKIPYADAIACAAIAAYLVYLSIHIMLSNVHPLVDRSVLDAKTVEDAVNSIEGVLYCHNIRSRGEREHHFLDLNIHLPGHITLDRAHEITHNVEEKLKSLFPGLKDVVIHTEPHGHPPCSKDH